MIPQRAEILPRSIRSNEQAPLGKGIFLPLDTGNHLLGIKELPKPLNAVSGELRDQWAYMAHLTAARYPYETLVSPFARGSIIGSRDGYSAFDFSILSGARRKNATRETTSPLKAWLHEHRKNPYPTKGEKIMLAILTKMTLTQISTWFANARRRLKKDNKMTWSPRNKSSDKRESSCKSSKKDDTGRSISSIDDDDDDFSECMDTNERDPQHSCSKDLSKFDDLDMNDDVFTDDGKSTCGDEKPLKDQRPATKAYERDSKLRPQSSPDGILKKIDFAGNNSPVGNLQRWVDGHFGNQSPYDFPRELTPPRTPVEEVISPGTFISKEIIKEKETSLPVESEHEKVKSTEIISKCEKREKEVELKEQIESQQYPTTPSSLPEEYVRSVASNEKGLQGQFRSCGLTSHREIDAVLALTSLASR